jgi:hypothetical protein
MIKKQLNLAASQNALSAKKSLRMHKLRKINYNKYLKETNGLTDENNDQQLLEEKVNESMHA